MPLVPIAFTVPANGSALPLSGSLYEYLPWPALVEVAITAAVTGIVATVNSGPDTLQEEGPTLIKVGTPVYPDDYQLRDEAAPGDRLKIFLRNTTGAGILTYTFVQLTPIG